MKFKQITRVNIFLISAIVICIDQATKYLATTAHLNIQSPIFSKLIEFNLVHNQGAAFSLLTNFPLFLLFISTVVTIVILFLMFQESNFTITKGLYLAFLLGGTAGNGIDRLRLGHVTDSFN